MIIRDVGCFHLRSPIQIPYGDSRGLKSARETIIIKIDTDAGIVGWGEVCPYGLQGKYVNRLLQMIVGMDPLNTDAVVDQLGSQNWRVAAGTEIGLWDIKGKAAGMPLAVLWGGMKRQAQPCYASLQNFTDRADLEAHAEEELGRALDMGFKAVKMKVGGHKPDLDLKWLERVAKWLPNGIPLAIDANQAFDLHTALYFAHRVQDLMELAWFEEPVFGKSLSDYCELTRRLNIPIAGAESIDVDGVAEAIVSRSMTIVNPDLVIHGGLRQFGKYAALCDHFGVKLVPHLFDGQLIRVATLHFLVTQPDWNSWQTTFTATPLEYDISPNPLRDNLLLEPIFPDRNGAIPIPSAPGLGVGINEDLLTEYQL